MKGQIKAAKAVIKNITDEKVRNNTRKNWDKAIRPFKEYYAKVRVRGHG